MKHLIKKEKNILHGTIGWSHNGKDGQYCEAGETVRIKWQPNAGWGLKEVHYTDGDGNVVAIVGGEFVMPDSAVVIGGTFKRFSLDDWANDPYKPTPQPRYLTFTAGEGGASVGFYVNTQGYEVPQQYVKPNLQYSLDGGKTWQDYDLQFSEDGSEAVTIELSAGDNVMFKGVNDYLAYFLEDEGDTIYTQCIIDGSVAASGDVTSLLNGEGGDVSLSAYCFYNMFSGCTGLTAAPELPATTLAESCYNSMFYGCTAIISHDVAMLNDSGYVFQNNTSCTSLTIHADTPPTIGSNTISGLKADCVIYVPAASVDAYKAAQYWSAHAAYIQAIQ